MADFNWKASDGLITVARRDANGDSIPSQTLVIDTNRYPDHIKRKLVDFAGKAFCQARASGVETEEKLGYWAKLDALLASGEWEFPRVSGPRTVPTWIEALAEAQGCLASEVQQSLADYSEADRAEIEATVKEQLADRIAELENRQKVDLTRYLPAK